MVWAPASQKESRPSHAQCGISRYARDMSTHNMVVLLSWLALSARAPPARISVHVCRKASAVQTTWRMPPWVVARNFLVWVGSARQRTFVRSRQINACENFHRIKCTATVPLVEPISAAIDVLPCWRALHWPTVMHTNHQPGDRRAGPCSMLGGGCTGPQTEQ